MKILLAAIAVFCASGWLTHRLLSLALLLYMAGKGCPEPTREELEVCLREVIRNLIKDLW